MIGNGIICFCSQVGDDVDYIGWKVRLFEQFDECED